MATHYNGYTSGAMAFLIGAAIGGGAMLLWAPQSGAKTRRMIRFYAENTLEDALDKGQEALGLFDAAMCQGRKVMKTMHLA